MISNTFKIAFDEALSSAPEQITIQRKRERTTRVNETELSKVVRSSSAPTSQYPIPVGAITVFSGPIGPCIAETLLKLDNDFAKVGGRFQILECLRSFLEREYFVYLGG